MLVRKAYDKLKRWKEASQGQTSLLINGARRVGKSYLCREFAQREYKSFIFIDFGNAPPEIKDLVENESYNLDNFFLKLSLFYGVTLYERESLIVFDEIQCMPRARQLLKYLVADGRYDYIGTGSLLSIKQNVENIIIPSEERQINLYPLDFEEFLWALGDQATVPMLASLFEKRIPLGQAAHRRILNDFRKYLLVGGMPQAVVEFVKTNDFNKVDEVKRNIISLYRNDIGKFADRNRSKVLSIFDELPGQLSKKEKKYALSSISKEARLRDYEDAFMWLEDAMITNTCYNATDPRVGLSLSSDFSTRKCYVLDTGLLVTMALNDKESTDHHLYRDVMFGRLGLNEGMLMENVVAQMLRTSGHRLFFYSRTDLVNRENHMEIDFLITNKRKVSPIEVKSSTYRKHSSLDKFNHKFRNRIGDSIILYQKDVALINDVWHYPLYMAMFL